MVLKNIGPESQKLTLKPRISKILDEVQNNNSLDFATAHRLSTTHRELVSVLTKNGLS